MTFRVWLTSGKYVLVEAETPEKAIRALSRTKRKQVTSAKPIFRRKA